ncbi:MAG TPA: hypothetical protein VF607_00585 [Verrucomicrobiae bacterium]
MNNPIVMAAASVTEADLTSARLGPRFGRLDLQSRLALLAVVGLGLDFSRWSPEQVGIVLAARAGSLATDVQFWHGRHGAGGPSPTLFAYTLPSAAVGEIAIHYKLTGPDLCLIGDDRGLLGEGAAMIERGEVAACLCVYCEVITPDCAAVLGRPAAAAAHALCLTAGGPGRDLREFDRDIKGWCALISSNLSAG